MRKIIDRDVFNGNREFRRVRSGRVGWCNFDHSIRDRKPQMAVSALGSTRKNSAARSDLKSLRVSIKNRVNSGALSRGPFGQALLIDGRNTSKPGEPEAVVGIVD